MKKLLLSLSLTLSLNATLLSSESDFAHKRVVENFRQTVTMGNSILKRGEYEKYRLYQEETAALLEQLKVCDITSDERESIEKNMLLYRGLIEAVYRTIKEQTPDIYKHYQLSFESLLPFRKHINATGYAPLIQECKRLSKIGTRFIKRPSKKFHNEFQRIYSAIEMILDDLCLDEEIEMPILLYLRNYKAYFEELNLVYSTLEYNNIKRIKPLSYEIKARLELVSTL